MADCDCHLEAQNRAEQRTLRIVLVVNLLMFGVEAGVGAIAQSTGLLADSLDMLADAMVYGISLTAVGKSQGRKVGAARLSGWLQLTLGCGVLIDVLRRFVQGSEPQSGVMIGVGLLALIANVLCLTLIARHRHQDVNMRASWIFSRNDVIANMGVMVAGGLVALFNSRMPDLLIGGAIAVLVIRGGVTILQSARKASSGQAF